jgi:hypothetical protein
VIKILEIYTSQFRYSGKTRMDITVKSGNIAFAPTWDMVMRYKNGTMSEQEYTVLYLKILDNSYVQNKSEWDKLLAMESVIFVCFCPKNKFCHRHLLANYLLGRFPDKVVLKGEI